MTTPFVFSTKVHTLDNFFRGVRDWARERLTGDRGGAPETASVVRSGSNVGWAVVAVVAALPLLALFVGSTAPGAAAAAAAAPSHWLRVAFGALVLVVGYLLAYRLPRWLLGQLWGWIDSMCRRGHELKHGLRRPVSL